MEYASLQDFLREGKQALARGPVALIFVEDEVELDTTLRHYLQCGFRAVLALMPPAFDLPKDLAKDLAGEPGADQSADPAGRVHRISFDCSQPQTVFDAVNQVIEAAPGIWLYYGYNAEYLFYPFCETRTVGEMLAFHAEERRDAMLAYVIDLYAGDLAAYPDAISLDEAFLDKSGYYALARPDPGNHNHPKERQLDFFGGLRWRYEEHIPQASRKIDRIALFRARPGLRLRPDHTFNDEEYNTYACPWHHNLTAAVCSFRTAKALKSNPGSTFDIKSFLWHKSAPFEWHSRQLMDLGLMEPGQWF